LLHILNPLAALGTKGIGDAAKLDDENESGL
jgi:hypothetical protein